MIDEKEHEKTCFSGPVLPHLILFFRCIGLPSNLAISFFLFFYSWIIFHFYMYRILLIYPSVNGHLGCFLLLAIVNGVAMNMESYIFLRSYIYDTVSKILPYSVMAYEVMNSFLQVITVKVISWRTVTLQIVPILKERGRAVLSLEIYQTSLHFGF